MRPVRIPASAEPRAAVRPAISERSPCPKARRVAARPLRLRIPACASTGIPVYVVGLNTNPSFFPALNCIADESGGQLFAATDEADLLTVLESLLDFKRSANFFASPSLPAFAGGFGDTAQIGAVVPSHLNENGDLSSWSVWSGTVKSYQLDSNGLIPVVTAPPATVTPTPTSGGPTATPAVGTPTPTPVITRGPFRGRIRPEQRQPGGPQAGLERRPRPRLHEPGSEPGGQCHTFGGLTGRPGARDLRLARTQDALLPPVLGCSGDARRLHARHRDRAAASACFDGLMTDMGLDPASTTDQQSGGSDGSVPAGRQDEFRQPRRDPERRLDSSGHDRNDRPGDRRGTEVLVLLPGRRARSGSAASGPHRRRRVAAGGLRAQDGRRLPLRAPVARAAAVLPVPLGQRAAAHGRHDDGRGLSRLRESPVQTPESPLRRRQRRLPARLRRRRLEPRHGQLQPDVRPRNRTRDLRVLADEPARQQVHEPAELPAASAVLRGRLRGVGRRLGRPRVHRHAGRNRTRLAHGPRRRSSPGRTRLLRSRRDAARRHSDQPGGRQLRRDSRKQGRFARLSQRRRRELFGGRGGVQPRVPVGHVGLRRRRRGLLGCVRDRRRAPGRDLVASGHRADQGRRLGQSDRGRRRIRRSLRRDLRRRLRSQLHRGRRRGDQARHRRRRPGPRLLRRGHRVGRDPLQDAERRERRGRQRGLRSDARGALGRGLQRRRLSRRGLHRRRQRPDVAHRPHAGCLDDADPGRDRERTAPRIRAVPPLRRLRGLRHDLRQPGADLLRAGHRLTSAGPGLRRSSGSRSARATARSSPDRTRRLRSSSTSWIRARRRRPS